VDTEILVLFPSRAASWIANFEDSSIVYEGETSFDINICKV
jgi:hypothetical protein